MTRKEKDAVRARACALCLANPPFSDGSRSHVHRILRGKDGGTYTFDNVLPLCPPCHKNVDRVACLTAARVGGLIGGPRAGRRRAECTVEERRRMARIAGLASMSKRRALGLNCFGLTREQARIAGARGGRVGGKEGGAALTGPAKSEACRKGWITRRARGSRPGGRLTGPAKSAACRKGWLTRRARGSRFGGRPRGSRNHAS